MLEVMKDLSMLRVFLQNKSEERHSSRKQFWQKVQLKRKPGSLPK